jgi:hypothetical protein
MQAERTPSVRNAKYGCQLRMRHGALDARAGTIGATVLRGECRTSCNRSASEKYLSLLGGPVGQTYVAALSAFAEKLAYSEAAMPN